jgi:hypothetical protein
MTCTHTKDSFIAFTYPFLVGCSMVLTLRALLLPSPTPHPSIPVPHPPHPRLIAAATVPKTGYWLADFILSLPTAAYARLPTSLTFLSEPAPVGAASSSQEEEDVMQPAAH